MLGSNLAAVYKCDSQRRLPWLRQSIISLHRQAPSAEAVVLSTDAEIRSQIETDDDLARTVGQVLDAPKALTAARNEGVSATERKWIAFLDDDAIPTERWWPALGDILARFDADAAGGPLVPRWQTPEPTWLPESYHWLIGCGPYYDGRRMVANTYGSNLVVRREAFEAVGGFDESIGMGSGGVGQAGETNLCRRLRAAGYEAVAYHPDAAVQHVIEPANVAPSALFRRAYEQGRAKAIVGLGAREASFLREELGRGGTPLQRAVEVLLTGAVGAGFLRGKVVG